MSATLKNRSIELAASAKTLGKDIHNHLMAIAKHIEASKDTTPATHFLTLLRNHVKNADSDGKMSASIVRDDAIKNWLEAFAFCKWGKHKDGKEGFKFSKTMLEGKEADHYKVANRNPWNKYTPAKPYAIFDLDAALASLIKRAGEKAEETGPNGETHKVDTAKLAKMRELARELEIEIK